MDDKLLDRICKIRRLARDNPSKEEAASAETKLKDMLKENDLTEVDLDLFENRPDLPQEILDQWEPIGAGVVVLIYHAFGIRTNTSSAATDWVF